MQVERPPATSSVSDISDTELPEPMATESSDNAGGAGLSDLEAERAKIRAQLAKAKISEAEELTTSEGEIHSSDDQAKKTAGGEDASGNKEKLETSPISSSEDPSPVPPKVRFAPLTRMCIVHL